jgi:hypothetical protein
VIAKGCGTAVPDYANLSRRDAERSRPSRRRRRGRRRQGRRGDAARRAGRTSTRNSCRTRCWPTSARRSRAAYLIVWSRSRRPVADRASLPRRYPQCKQHHDLRRRSSSGVDGHRRGRRAPIVGRSKTAYASVSPNAKQSSSVPPRPSAMLATTSACSFRRR